MINNRELAVQAANELGLRYEKGEWQVSIFFHIEEYAFRYISNEWGACQVKTSCNKEWCEGRNGDRKRALYSRGDVMGSLIQAMASAKEFVEYSKNIGYVYECEDCKKMFTYLDILERSTEDDFEDGKKVCLICIRGYTREERMCFRVI